MVILFSIIMGILGTAAVFGLFYLFYEIIMDSVKPPSKEIETPVTSTKLRFKKPNL